MDGHGGAPNTLVDDLKALLNDPALSDIAFVFPEEGNKKIHAHKNILAARCAPMQALLRSGMREAHSGVVVIDSVEHATFYALLEYLYTGTLAYTEVRVIKMMEMVLTCVH